MFFSLKYAFLTITRYLSLLTKQTWIACLTRRGSHAFNPLGQRWWPLL